MVTSTRAEVEEMSVLLAVPVFPVLPWWLSTWNGLFLVVFPCLHVRNTHCNGRACEQSQVVIVAVRACTYADTSVSSLVAVAFRLHAALMICSLDARSENRGASQPCGAAAHEEWPSAEFGARWPVLSVVSRVAQ